MADQSILFVGNLVAVKAPARVIAAFAEIAGGRPGLSLDIVGDGRRRKQLQKQVVDLGLANRVTFHGRQPPETVADMMRAASCLCLTSKSEGMPNVVVESLACGTPVVATSVGEVPYLMKEGINGTVVATGMADEPRPEAELVADIAEALERVLNAEWDPAVIAQTVAGFTWEAAAQTVVDAIDGV
jgi:glycosyltransferase involved in cell wall biosynthesis